jgi:hypothetical protein
VSAARIDKRARATGRAEDGGSARHVRLYFWMMATPAWQALDTVARCAYIELARLYSGSNNGSIGLSTRTLAKSLHVSTKTAARALRTLEHAGFIVATLKGAFHCKVRLASEYRLTEFPCDKTGALPTKDFARKTTVVVVTP